MAEEKGTNGNAAAVAEPEVKPEVKPEFEKAPDRHTIEKGNIRYMRPSEWVVDQRLQPRVQQRTDADLLKLAVSIYHAGLVTPMVGGIIEELGDDKVRPFNFGRAGGCMLVWQGFTCDDVQYPPQKDFRVPVIVRKYKTLKEALADSIVTNVMDEPTVLDNANSAHQLKASGFTNREIMQKLGFESAARVTQLLQLGELCDRMPIVRERIIAGRVSAKAASHLWKAPVDQWPNIIETVFATVGDGEKVTEQQMLSELMRRGCVGAPMTDDERKQLGLPVAKPATDNGTTPPADKGTTPPPANTGTTPPADNGTGQGQPENKPRRGNEVEVLVNFLGALEFSDDDQLSEIAGQLLALLTDRTATPQAVWAQLHTIRGVHASPKLDHAYELVAVEQSQGAAQELAATK